MKSILFVEDDPFIYEVYSTRFREDGYVVDIANNCEMAFEKIFQKYPDVVVLDVNFGDGQMSGIDLLKKVKSDPRAKNIRILILSNYDRQYIDEHYDIVMANFGDVHFFVKAETSVDDIVKAVDELLKHSAKKPS